MRALHSLDISLTPTKWLFIRLRYDRYMKNTNLIIRSKQLLHNIKKEVTRIT